MSSYALNGGMFRERNDPTGLSSLLNETREYSNFFSESERKERLFSRHGSRHWVS